jgi:hypothetical protein
VPVEERTASAQRREAEEVIGEPVCGGKYPSARAANRVKRSML